MPTLVLDPKIEEQLLERRRACRGDRHDEVWEGVYIMSPLANIEHQEVVMKLGIAFANALSDQPGVRVFPGVNVSDRQVGWEQNYRCPDVAVVLPNSSAVDCGAFYFGGPDFLVEVASDYDRSREKFDFYASVGVREFLMVDRNPWQLELYGLQSDGWNLTGNATLSNALVLASKVLPLTFQLAAPALPGRPQIVVATPHGERRWFA